MKSFRNKIFLPAALCLAAITAGCTENKTEPLRDDPNEIRLRGMSADRDGTRVGLVEELPIYLVAFNRGDMSRRYFDATRITSAASLGTSPSDLTLNTKRYYPLGGNEISLFAYTGSVNSNYEMELRAGNTGISDYVLSNYGQRSGDSDINQAYEGEGTPGSSDSPAEILQFRHVMTQLTVEVEVDQTQSNYVDPEPEMVEFRINGMYEQGYYPITAKTPDLQNLPVEVADNGSGSYTAKLGVNYLVPSGLNLVGKVFSHLKIDDYQATAADLTEFVIAGSNAETDMNLYPGYAYTLTLKIQKLRLVGVELKQVDWIERYIDGDRPSYDPNILNLDIEGGYSNSGDDRITKVVLHADLSGERRQYVGKAGSGANELDFVTLPADGLVDSVDLYTDRGLLLSMPVNATQYASNTLSFNLSDVGMLLADPSGTNSEANPYLVTTLVQFLNISKDLSGYYRQMDDIEIEAILGTGFNGFGIFSGRYDGNGYWIGNLDVSCPGLFSENDGELIDIRLYTGNMDLSGYGYAGSVCGINRGLIFGCLNEVSLLGATGTVGGIVGLNEAGGRVVGCVNTGNIRSGSVVAGICGENRNTAADTFVSCLAIGNVQPGSTTGAVIGASSDAPSTVVVNTCFWLEGTVGTALGQSESLTGSGTVGYEDSSSLSPEKMRNQLADGETEADKVVNRLNAALQSDSDYITSYLYLIDPVITGITWPAIRSGN